MLLVSTIIMIAIWLMAMGAGLFNGGAIHLLLLPAAATTAAYLLTLKRARTAGPERSGAFEQRRASCLRARPEDDEKAA